MKTFCCFYHKGTDENRLSVNLKQRNSIHELWKMLGGKHILFPEACVIAHTRTGTHVSKFTCAICPMHEMIILSHFVLLLLYISYKETFLSERFFIEYYIQKI